MYERALPFGEMGLYSNVKIPAPSPQAAEPNEKIDFTDMVLHSLEEVIDYGNTQKTKCHEPACGTRRQ
jgi:hypothetical protein